MLLEGLDKYNNIFMMADSGARGSDKQIKQLAGMRGLMADTTGRTIELPIKSNFRDGLDVLEYFMSAHGARKGMSDTALRTADSGYLTRRLVDVSQHMIVRESDCCEGKNREIPGMWVTAFMDGKEEIESLQERITGRFSCNTICDKDGNVIVKANHMITPKRAAEVMSRGVDENGNPIEKVKIRTVLSCRSHMGVCAKCYGANMATGQAVQVGEAVGIIAAQSIGEPGTQLTMRTFHTGGVAGTDITQGLPRVEEIFEARKPKGLAIITEFGGVANIKDTKKKREIIVTNNETGESKAYLIPYGSRIKVMDGAVLEAGDELTEGSVNPHDILKIKGVRAVQDYMLREVQRVYRLQGVEINDKHIELIVRQMLQKVRVETNGDSDMLPGTLVDTLDFEDTNELLESEGKEMAEGKQVLLGITKASLATNSFLSAASFQETTKVLTEAAVKMSIRYINDRFLPDKAIDLIDEAASRAKLKSYTEPDVLKQLEEKIEEVEKDKEEAVRIQKFEKAASLRDKQKELKEKYEKEQKKWKNKNNKEVTNITEENIAEVIANWTGIPAKKITEDENIRLKNLEKNLHERVIGQDEAVEAVAKAIRRGTVGLKDPKRPIGSFLFLGPTGVGKTELSKALAESLFGDENAMIRVDMSEYMEPHSVSKLIGSPPGYVGFDEGGQLTEKIRRKPYSVILFDEIEKAHPDVMNMLLQILEDGRLTDSQGRTVNFKNTVIIMTSNIGARLITDKKMLGFSKNEINEEENKKEYEETKKEVMEALKKELRPEFINRIDEIIVFHKLTDTEISQIIDIMLKEVTKRLEAQKIKIELEPEVKELIASKGIDKNFGARPLRRTIQSVLEDKLAEEILDGNLKKNKLSKIGVKDEKVVVL